MELPQALDDNRARVAQGLAHTLVETRFVNLLPVPALELAARQHMEQFRRSVPEVRRCCVTVRALPRAGAQQRYAVSVDADLISQVLSTCRIDAGDASTALARAFEGLQHEIGMHGA